MATMFAKHPVNNYASWKRVYDNFAQYRKENGVTGASVHRDPADPNMIIVTHQFGNLSQAQAFANSEDLKAAMQEAGVSRPPEIWVTEDIESTPY